MNDKQLETLVEDLVIQVGEQEDESLWQHFTPQHMKLHLAKQLLKYIMPRLNKLIPDRKPSYPQTKIFDDVLLTFEKMIEDQMKSTCQKCNHRFLPKKPRKALHYPKQRKCPECGSAETLSGELKDYSFYRLVKTARRLIVFVGEEDIYYRGWLNILLITLFLQVKTKLPQLAVIENITLK